MSSCWQLDFSSTPPPTEHTRSGSPSSAAETFANEQPSVCLLEVLPARPVITLHTAGVRQRREVSILQHFKRQHPGQSGPSPVGNQSQRSPGGAPLPSPLKTTTRTSQCSGTFSLSSHCCPPRPPVETLKFFSVLPGASVPKQNTPRTEQQSEFLPSGG